jgi:serine-type D-Ala-D-Ala carboxypeptidase
VAERRPAAGTGGALAGGSASGGTDLGWDEVEQAFEQAVERRVFPGATVVVRKGAEVAYEGAFGFRTLIPEPAPIRIDTVFDLSSLTKALATTVAVMMLARDGKLRLDDRVTRFFPSFGVHGKGRITFRHLLAHCSGLAAWRPFYQQIVEVERQGKVNFMASHSARDWIYAEVNRDKPQAPPLSKTIYSDLNFIVLGEAVEQASALALNRFCREKIYRPIGLRATDFIDLSLARARRLEPVADMFAATEICPARKRLLVGEVHDENAFAMGGVAGHAGLFAPVREVDRLARELVDCYHGRSSLIPQKIIAEFWTRDKTVGGSSWALGWDTPSPEYSSSGRYFPRTSVGHLGFTGTSIWIDPQREIVVTILTNRVHPSRESQQIREFRPAIHDLIMEALEGGA